MSFVKQENIKNNTFNYPAILKGALYAMILSALGSGLTGVVYHLTSLPEGTMSWLAAVILAVSVLAGGLSAARSAGFKGLYHGLGVGVIFFLASWLIAAMFMPVSLAFVPMLQKLLLALLAGGLGGVLGVGLAS